MSTFDWLKALHVSCALLSISGFALRGYWVLSDNPSRSLRLTRLSPHIVDTLLLASAVTMLVIWEISPLQLDWLMAKIAALLVYIGLGIVLMRFADSHRSRQLTYAAALLTAAYILSVAYTKSPWGLLSLFTR